MAFKKSLLLLYFIVNQCHVLFVCVFLFQISHIQWNVILLSWKEENKLVFTNDE